MAVKRKQTHTVHPVLFDRMNGLAHLEGAEVHVIQPYGCPRNGTMGMTYVQHAESGEFIGLVCQTSLKKTGRTAPVRDLAAEARDARSAAMFGGAR